MDRNQTTSRCAQILVVDDDQLVRDVTLRRLKGLGYRAIAAASGAEALEALASGADIDVLLTDIRMPGACMDRLSQGRLGDCSRRSRCCSFPARPTTTRCCGATPTMTPRSFSSSRAPRPSLRRRSARC